MTKLNNHVKFMEEQDIHDEVDKEEQMALDACLKYRDRNMLMRCSLCRVWYCDCHIDLYSEDFLQENYEGLSCLLVSHVGFVYLCKNCQSHIK